MADNNIPVTANADVSIDCDNDANGSTQKIIFSHDNGTELMRIQEDGKVGINATNPQAQLHVGILAADSDLSYTASSTVQGFLVNTYSDSADVYRRRVDLVALGDQNGTAGGGAFRFITNPNNSYTALERMRIDRTGYVGIGQTSPAALLHVKCDGSP